MTEEEGKDPNSCRHLTKALGYLEEGEDRDIYDGLIEWCERIVKTKKGTFERSDVLGCYSYMCEQE